MAADIRAAAPFIDRADTIYCIDVADHMERVRMGGTAQPPLDVERLTGIIEDIPPHIIKAAAGDSAEGLAAMIVARLAASSEHPEPTGETPQP